jgi:copper chaperone
MSLKIKVPDMACGACSAVITQAVAAVDATATVEADLKTKWVNIETQVNDALVKTAIAAAGYTIAD